MQSGDLIFSFIGSEQNAISAVTEGYRGARVNHVGVIVTNGLGTFVLEAFPPEVRLTNIEVFKRRSEDSNGAPRLILGRLQNSHHTLIPDALTYGLMQRNVPYDVRYMPSEAALYCSELIVDMFKHANGGTEFFEENPMSFRDTATGEIHPTWIRYYAQFGMAVPEGEPGSNPGDISKDARLSVLDVIGNIPGYQP